MTKQDIDNALKKIDVSKTYIDDAKKTKTNINPGIGGEIDKVLAGILALERALKYERELVDAGVPTPQVVADVLELRVDAFEAEVDRIRGLIGI